MSAGASAAAAAAAAARRRMEQEKEEMTDYSPQDLSNGWEFKILRSALRNAFRDPEKLKQILAEEKRAGWIMVEKFDDNRIRLKRPASAHEFDSKLEFDPYRTFVGPSEAKIILIVLGIAFGALAAIFGIIALVVRRS